MRLTRGVCPLPGCLSYQNHSEVRGPRPGRRWLRVGIERMTHQLAGIAGGGIRPSSRRLRGLLVRVPLGGVEVAGLVRNMS